MTLSTKAMLITLSVSCWTGSRKDERVVEEVNARHGAKDSGRFSKYLVAKEELQPLSSHASAIRAMHYRMTLPWLDNGSRLLPAKVFGDYSKELRQMKADYEALVDKFVIRYDTFLRPDAAIRLGSLYDSDDYPTGDALREKFDVTTDIAPVPSGSDFRVDVGDSERERIRAEIDAQFSARLKSAVDDAWKRVREVVGNISVRLSADKPILRESLIDNAADLARVLPGLNVTDDPQLEAVCRDITNNLLVDIVTLRTSKRERMRVAAIAERILSQVPT